VASVRLRPAPIEGGHEMYNRYEMDTSGRLVHEQRLEEAEQERLAQHATGAPHRPARSSGWQTLIGQALLAWGRWMDGRTRPEPRHDAEREGAV
jgi:hypothetical protein